MARKRHLLAVGLVLTAGTLTGCRWPEGQLTATRHAGSASRADDRYVQQAQQYLEQGLTDSALAEFSMALAENPRLTEAHMGIGHLFRERGDYRMARRRYKRATELEPDNADAHYYLGLMRQMLGDIQEAAQTYLQALAIEPDNEKANRDLAAAYLQLGEPSQAVPYARRAAEASNGDQGAWSNLAAAYSLTGQYEKAVEAYRQAVELGEPAEELLLGLADAHIQLENYGRAINTLQPLVEQNNPTSPAALERLGYARFKLREYEAALQHFEQALRRDPEHAAALNGKGVALMTLYLEGGRENESQRREALEAWRKSLQVRPDQPRITDLISQYSRS
jgi:tetratricopeptide (TPR) repeat protein